MTSETNVSEKVIKRPAHYEPIQSRDSGHKDNPDSTIAQVTAFRTVLIHLLLSAFALTEDEVLWVGHRLDAVLAPLINKESSVIPFPVRQEMVDGNYTRLIALDSKKHLLKRSYNPQVLSATLEEWTDMIVAPIFASYNLRPLDEVSIRSKVSTLLKDLGVDDPLNPRMSIYLPSDLRYRIFNDRSAK